MKPEDINRDLAAFAADPKAFMTRPLPKTDGSGKKLDHGFSAFGRKAVARDEFVDARDQVRKTLFTVEDGVVIKLDEILPGRAPIEAADRPESLVDELRHTTLDAIEKADLMSAELEETPWSDDYWAIYQGQLGHRYADPKWPKPDHSVEDWGRKFGWMTHRDYVRERHASKIVASGDADAINRLSPSEKYDLLVGDDDWTFTRYMWEQGRYYYERSNEVQTWMGICHGWAPVAYMLPRPVQAVTLTSPDGLALRFYPSDVKSLASQLWARARTASRFVGGRCNDKDPETDENGRSLSQKCFDTNPATWHLSVVNQIGVARRSFIIDATYDYEVWNQPVHRYSYTYFDPNTRTQTHDLRAAMVTRSELSDDKFAKYRSDEAKFIVGVAMKVDYVVETRPTTRETDDASHDALNGVTYYYDLELDGEGRPIGGEWYTALHPDFLWTPPPHTRAVTPFEAMADGAWSPKKVMPPSWRHAAQFGARQGLPLAKIVEQVIAHTHLV